MTRLYKLPTKTILTFVRQTELRNKNLVKIPGQNEINPASNSLIKTFQRGSLERGIPISDATHASIAIPSRVLNYSRAWAAVAAPKRSARNIHFVRDAYRHASTRCYVQFGPQECRYATRYPYSPSLREKKTLRKTARSLRTLAYTTGRV